MDVHDIAVNGLKGACNMFLQDLQALPEEAFAQRFSNDTRTVADIVYEVNLVNDHIGMVLRGEPPFEWPDGGWITAPEDFQTKDVVIAGFKASSKRAIATVDALTEEELAGTVETEHGSRTRYQRCQFMTLHLWYHSGQLNFIQTLRGDKEWHWNG